MNRKDEMPEVNDERVRWAMVIVKIAAKEKENRDLAVAEMKERCAQVAENNPAGKMIAAAIRALDQKS